MQVTKRVAGILVLKDSGFNGEVASASLAAIHAGPPELDSQFR